jgi:hypothetical protein
MPKTHSNSWLFKLSSGIDPVKTGSYFVYTFFGSVMLLIFLREKALIIIGFILLGFIFNYLKQANWVYISSRKIYVTPITKFLNKSKPEIISLKNLVCVQFYQPAKNNRRVILTTSYQNVHVGLPLYKTKQLKAFREALAIMNVKIIDLPYNK